MANSKHQGWILGIVIFIMGGCGLAYEYTFSKIASDLLGNSVQQWAVVIAIMLFCMGVGAEIQRFIKKDNVISTLLYSQLILALLGGFGPLLLLVTFSSFPFNFGLIHYGMICMIGVLIGFEIPLITRINEDYADDIRSNLAWVLKMDYIGALAGALTWVFILPKFFTLHQTAYILAFLSLAATIACWWFFRSKIKKSSQLLLSISASIIALIFGFSQSDKWAIHAEQGLYRDQVIHRETTPYQHIVLTQSNHGTLRCYINGHIQFSSSDEYIYHEQLVHPAISLSPHAKRVLILGGGDGLAVREVLKYKHIKEIVLVDLDPAMTQLASTHSLLTELNDNALNAHRVSTQAAMGISTGENYTLETPNQRRTGITLSESDKPQLKVLNIDASNYIKQAEGLFDVIICDFPDPSSPELAKLYSLHFYGKLKTRLAPDGYIVQQATSPYRAKDAFLCIGRTMKAAGLSALPYHDHVPSFGEWGWWIATHQSLKSPQTLKSDLKKNILLPDNIRYLTPEIIHSSLEFGKNQLLTSEDDITTISNSAVLNHYLNGWLD